MVIVHRGKDGKFASTDWQGCCYFRLDSAGGPRAAQLCMTKASPRHEQTPALVKGSSLTCRGLKKEEVSSVGTRIVDKL